MELSAWRDAVPFGAYLQPIRLTVASDADHAAQSSTKAAPAPAKAPSAVNESRSAVAPPATDGSAALPPTAGAAPAATDSSTLSAASDCVLADPATSEVPAPSPTVANGEAHEQQQQPQVDEENAILETVVVIPPFEGECVEDNSARMVMNAGGPVWALDWLPHHALRRRRRKPTAASVPPATTAATGASVTTNATKKKPGRKANGTAVVAPTESPAVAPEPLGGVNGNGNNEDDESDRDDDSDAADALRVCIAREWRFLALSTHPPCEVVDGALVKPTPPDHYYNVQTSNTRGLIQIWAVPVPPKAARQASGQPQTQSPPPAARRPILVYGIDHASGIAWDLQWCPTMHAMPKRVRSKQLLGVLAACFSDGSVQVFEVPALALEQLAVDASGKTSSAGTAHVETLAPTIRAHVPGILQLSIQWSPHRWNLLLTGGSDGSVSLWNLEWELSKQVEIDTSGDRAARLPTEPQRRFQDVDTVGKQEAFDWGWGWVAVRAVSWSPFDEFLFATTGNDSVFKVWDIREPRICVRSHRIRSTWGLALQWMDHTTIQVSGDQGSIYMYDILSGSYQKLHFHPQIDSPVWDLQFARRGTDVPLLASCCTSGCIRVAPAKRLFRSTQHSVELCRIAGDRDASVYTPEKALRVDFAHRVVTVNSEVASPATRTFCERDAALHRLRINTSAAGAFPCLLATSGHAGLVVVLEIQEALDQLLEKHFLPANKTLGRPRKGSALWVAMKKLREQEKTKKMPTVASKKVKATAAAGGRAQAKRAHIKSKKMHNALAKYKSATKKAKAPAKATKAKESALTEDVDTPSVDVSEEDEYVDDGDDVSDTSDSLLLADIHSDDEDERASVSDVGDDDDNPSERGLATQLFPERARMMAEYQLDLSEEDAIMLAIQMSEMEQTTPSKPPAAAAAKAKTKSKGAGAAKTPKAKGATSAAKAPAVPRKTAASASGAGTVARSRKTPQPKQSAKKATGESAVPTPGATATAAVVAPATATVSSSVEPMPTQKKTAKKTKNAPETSLDGGKDTADANATSASPPATSTVKKKKATTTAAAASASSSLHKTATGKRTAQPKKPSAKAKAPSGSTSSALAPDGAALDGFESYVLDQATTLQIIQFQNGMTEEDALLEAIRMSEVEAKRTSSATKASSRRKTDAQTAAAAAADPDATVAWSDSTAAVAAADTSDSTARRLDFAAPIAPAIAHAPCSASDAPAASVEASATAAAAASATARPKASKPRAAPAGRKPKAAKVAAPSAPKTSARGVVTDAPATGAPVDSARLDTSQGPKAATTSPSAAPKRKRVAQPAQPRKRGAKTASSGATKSERSLADDETQQKQREDSGYLTDEEALYLAIRASEVEY